MSEQRDRARERSKYHRERRERQRRNKNATSSSPKFAGQKNQQSKSSTIKAPQQAKPRRESQREIKTSVNPEEHKKAPYNIFIPTVSIARSTIEYVKIRLDTQYSLQKRKQDVNVPTIRISSPVLEFRNVPLDSNVTMPLKVKTPRGPPTVRLHAPVFEIQSNPLDSTVSIVSSPKSRQRIPKTSIKHVNKTQNKILPNPGQKRSIDTTKIETTQLTNASGLTETGTGGSIFEKEFPEFLETLFGIGGQELKEPSASVILFKDIKDEGYIHLFEKFLLRLQREKGRVGKVKKLTLISDDWNMEEVERWIDEGGMILIEVANKEVLERLSKQDLSDRLWTIFSKEDGVVIFHTENADAFSRINEIIQDINWNRLGLKPEIFKVIPRELPFDLKVKISKSIYGLVPIPDVAPNSKMSWIINTAEKQYSKSLKRIMHRYEPFFPVKATEDESVEHILAKYLIVHELIQKSQKEEHYRNIRWDWIRQVIETEPDTYPRPDVLYKPENEHFEFETLFGESFRKITNKLDEYSRAKPDAKVRIIVEPITVLLHLNEFKRQLAGINNGKLYSNLNVEYYTFDLSKERLMSLNEFFEAISKTLKELKREL